MAENAIKIIKLYKNLSSYFPDDVVNIIIFYLEKRLQDYHIEYGVYSYSKEEIETSDITKFHQTWKQHLTYVERYYGNYPLVHFYYEQDQECDSNHTGRKYKLYSFIPTNHEWFIVKNIKEEEEEEIKQCLLDSGSLQLSLDIHSHF
jgi:hypothetical protein